MSMSGVGESRKGREEERLEEQSISVVNDGRAKGQTIRLWPLLDRWGVMGFLRKIKAKKYAADTLQQVNKLYDGLNECWCETRKWL